MAVKLLPPVTPGEMILSFVEGCALLNDGELFGIILNNDPITPEIAEKLGKYFNVSADMWLNMQKHYDDESKARKKKNKNPHRGPQLDTEALVNYGILRTIG